MYEYAGAQTKCKWHGKCIRCIAVSLYRLTASTTRIIAAKLLIFFCSRCCTSQCTVTHASEKVFPTLESVSICVAWHIFGAEFSLDSSLFFLSHLLFFGMYATLNAISILYAAPASRTHITSAITLFTCILIDLIYNEAYDFLRSAYTSNRKEKLFSFRYFSGSK